MAEVNTFFCDCGRTIGRPEIKCPAEDAPPVFGVIHWYARHGIDGALWGIRCGDCGQWWEYAPPANPKDPYPEVFQTCKPNTCKTSDHINGECA